MISNSSKYGIRALTYLASQPKSAGMIGIKQISKDLELPSPFLAKILQTLARKKVLSSSKGPHGGFALLKDPKEITLLDVVRAIDSDEVLTNCVMQNRACKCLETEKAPCPVHDDYEKVRTGMIKFFSSKTIYNLVKTTNKSETVSI
jgi:Rrf2 family transcriptional regulator, iron-sulfur cluster assembly transcription factor